MAGRALTGDDALGRGVRESRCGERSPGRMTGIARLGCRNVVGRFAARRGTMAAGASARHHAEMSKGRAHPRGGAMAGIARLIGGRVICRLARGHAVVMALPALMGYHANVSEPCYLPRSGRGMALIACLLCRYVIQGFDGGGLNTAARCMTGLAWNLYMRARQRKAGSHVIKMHVAFGLGGRRIAVRAYEQEQAQCGKKAHPGRQSPELIS